jgi:hypothetical protein
VGQHVLPDEGEHRFVPLDAQRALGRPGEVRRLSLPVTAAPLTGLAAVAVLEGS